MPVQIAKWDSARDAWTDESRIDLFSGLSDAFLGTFTTSGMTVNGVAYELPTWGGATQDSGYSSSDDAALLPTVTVQDAANTGGPSQFDRNTPPLNTRVLMMPTPSANIGDNCGEQHPEKRRAGNHQPTIQDVAEHLLLPTPKASDGEKGGPNQRGSSGDWPLPAIGHLLPTPTVSDTNGPGLHGTGGMDLRTTVSHLPTPVEQPSGNTPEDHLRKKPGREVVTDLAIITENNLLPTGVRISPPSAAGKLNSDGQLHGQQSLLDAMAAND